MSVIDEIGNQIPNVEIDTVILEPNRVVVYLHIDEYVYRNTSELGLPEKTTRGS